MIVVDAERRPLGVFTLHDVERVAPLRPTSAPDRGSHAHQIWTLPPQAPAFEAALLMARENIRHVPLVEDGRLVGVVSESRLFSLWRGGIDEVRAAIRAARDVDATVAAASRIRALPGRLLDEGIGSDAITGLVTALNDLVTGRLIELTGAGAALAAAGDAGSPWGAKGAASRRSRPIRIMRSSSPTRSIPRHGARRWCRRLRWSTGPSTRAASRSAVARSWRGTRSGASRPRNGASASPTGSTHRSRTRC
jgi:CBS domain-containing protein